MRRDLIVSGNVPQSTIREAEGIEGMDVFESGGEISLSYEANDDNPNNEDVSRFMDNLESEYPIGM